MFTEKNWNELSDETKARFRNFALTHWRAGCPVPSGWAEGVKYYIQQLEAGQEQARTKKKYETIIGVKPKVKNKCISHKLK